MVLKTPTSSLTASELLVNKLWYRTKAKIEWFLFGGTPEAPTAGPSPITKLPQELVEIITSYLIHDTRSLLSCSMTSYSWYIAAVPHLHHSLTTDDNCLWPRESLPWPISLKKSYELGLLPLVKRFRIRMMLSMNRKFGPERLGRRTLCYFSALTNLQELGIDSLQVSSFMPTIQQCFGHFSPTLRFLALKEPEGSCRQILYFIGLFPNLQDLKILYPDLKYQPESTADATLVPLSVPPLQGRLTLTWFTRENIVKDMIALFGGLRFYWMDLFQVTCTRLLLDACTETLETLRLYPSEKYADNSALLRRFDLSHNKSLRTLETTAEAIDAVDTASDFLAIVLSSVIPSTPLDLVVIYREMDLSSMPHCSWCDSALIRSPRCPRTEEALRFQHQFKVFHEIHSARDFRLVLCADVFDCMIEDSIEKLEYFAKAEEVTWGLGYLPKRPQILFERRILRTHFLDQITGWTTKQGIYASAL